MESFSLFKYWRRGTDSSPASADNIAAVEAITFPEPSSSALETDNEATDDEGSFIDLEFDVPDDCSTKTRGGERGGNNNHSEYGEEEKNFNFSMTSSECSELRTLSPSDDLFFKGQLVPLEASSIVFPGAETDSKTQLAVSLMKSATKFRFFILGLRKPKSGAVEPNAASTLPKPSKFFFIKFKVEEGSMVSLFTREGSSRNQSVGAKSVEKITDTDAGEEAVVTPAVSENKSANSKEVVHKYLSKIKPLYIRVSKRYADKLKFTGPMIHCDTPITELNSGEEKETETEELAEMKMAGKSLKLALPAKLRVVYDRLGKSRSAASTVARVPSPPQRRDDSLLQQQDGIQSAIAHCKRSFTATSKELESPMLCPKSESVVDCV